jgi:iron-sulfur cluster repair protein YtfE (RIC family)
MQRGRLVGAVDAAHREVATRLAALEGAAAADRDERLAQLAAVICATAEAEEQVLFPAARRALGDNVLIDACAAEHSEAAHRLEALASHPSGAGFASAVSALATDVRNHMRDETLAVVPLLDEALGEHGAAELAADFDRALEH